MREGQSHSLVPAVIMVTPVKKVPIHLQSAQNRLIIKNGTVVNCDKEEQVDIYIEVSPTIFRVISTNITFLWFVKLSICVLRRFRDTENSSDNYKWNVIIKSVIVSQMTDLSRFSSNRHNVSHLVT